MSKRFQIRNIVSDNEDEENDHHDRVENHAMIPVARGPTQNQSPDLQQITDYLKKIIRKQNILQSALADLAEDITEIKSKIGQNNTNSVEDSESIFIAVNLPVNSNVDLQQLEEYLNVDGMMNSAVREIASFGGKSVYELIYRATQKLLTNRFAANYSYFGRQKKLMFSSLKLNGLLKKSAVRVFPNCTEKEAEVAIAKWLRCCTERSKKEQLQ